MLKTFGSYKQNYIYLSKQLKIKTMKEKSTTRKRAESLIREAQERFPFLDLETIQHICLFRIEGEIIKGDEINEFYYNSVKNWIISYTG